jgi:hypothetical protein
MFGRDSTGGALRIWTKRPAEEFGADVTATVGTLDRRDVKASLDLPLTDKLLTKVDGRESLPRRLHPQPAERPKQRWRRPASIPRRHRLDAHGSLGFPLQLLG